MNQGSKHLPNVLLEVFVTNIEFLYAMQLISRSCGCFFEFNTSIFSKWHCLELKKRENFYHQYIAHWFSHKRAWVSSSKKILNACLLGACKETILPPTCRNKSRKWLRFSQVLRFNNLILPTNSRNLYHTHAKFVWRNSSKVLVQWGKCTGM